MHRIYHVEEQEGETDTAQIEKMNEEREAADNSSKHGGAPESGDRQEEAAPSSEMKADETSVGVEKSEETAETPANSKSEQETKEDNTQDPESPIRLTLEEEETFHDDEVHFFKEFCVWDMYHKQLRCF